MANTDNEAPNGKFDCNIVALLPCMRLACGKFELTNQDLAGGVGDLTILTSIKVNGRGIRSGHFPTRNGINYSPNEIYNSKNHIRM